MAKKRVTIKDLAEKMNLSVSTISRAMHDHPSIGKKTKQEIRQMAKKLGYYPNSVASNLRRNRTFSIGIIVPRVDVHFHSLVISGIEEVAYQAGYSVSIYQTRDSLKREVAIVETLQKNMVEGVIACLALETEQSGHFASFGDFNVPVVFYDRVSDELDVNKVVIDDFESAFNATEHLVKQGCKRIAHISGKQTTGIFKSRLAGYKAALQKYDLPVDERLIVYTNDLSYDEGKDAANDFLKLKERPDGIFCANDYTAISAIQVFMKAGYKIPEDVAVIGFSNYPISRILEPALSSVDDRAFLMGKTAAKLLIRQIAEEDTGIASETIVLKTDLIIRDSSDRSKQG